METSHIHEPLVTEPTDDEHGVGLVLAQFDDRVVRSLVQLAARNARHIALQIFAQTLSHQQAQEGHDSLLLWRGLIFTMHATQQR